MSRILVIVAVTLWSAGVARAGSGAGNSGHGIGCRGSGGEITSVRLHDFYEGEYRYGFHPSLGGSELEPEQKAALALHRLERLDPERADRYRRRLDVFWSDATRWPNARLTFIPDSNHVALEKGCELVQLAIQKKRELPREKSVIIDEDLWKLMSKDHRAGLLLHEIVYREALALKHTDSTKARYFTSLIASAEIEKMSVKEYAQILKAIGFGYGDYVVDGIGYLHGTVVKYPSGQIKSAVLTQAAPFEVPSFRDGKVTFSTRGPIEFYENGVVRSGYPSSADLIDGRCRTWFTDSSNDRLFFAPDGTLEAVEYEKTPDTLPSGRRSSYSHGRTSWEWRERYSQGTEVRAICVPHRKYGTQTVHVSGRAVAGGRLRLEFHPSGILKGGKLCRHVETSYSGIRGVPAASYPVDGDHLYDADGKRVFFRSGQWIAFDEQGQVIPSTESVSRR